MVVGCILLWQRNPEVVLLDFVAGTALILYHSMPAVVQVGLDAITSAIE